MPSAAPGTSGCCERTRRCIATPPPLRRTLSHPARRNSRPVRRRGRPGGPARSALPGCSKIHGGARDPGREQGGVVTRSEEHTSELQSQFHLVCRLLLEKKK